MQPTSNPTPSVIAPTLDIRALVQANYDTRLRVLHLIQAGFRCVPVLAEDKKQLAYRDRENRTYKLTEFHGHAIAIRTGKLADDSYLCRIDIDQHANQDAEAAFERFMPLIETLPGKFAVRGSNRGKGYDLIFRSPCELPNNQPFLIDGRRAGEIFCYGGRVVDEGWIETTPEQLEILEEEELAYLLTLIQLLGTNAAKEISWQSRVREGMTLIRGYQTLDIAPLLGPDAMPKVFAGAKQAHQIAQSNWRRLQTAAKGARSELYANYVQSLMLLANGTFGKTLEEKSCTVAAIAIAHCPRTDKPRKHIEHETAALIARMLHGDPYKYRRGHFTIPYWAKEYRPPVRSPGRPRRTQQAQLRKLRTLLFKHAEGDRVEQLDGRKLTVTLLAKRLGVEDRTIQRYLAELEADGEISRDHVPGRGGHLVIHLCAKATSTPQAAIQHQPTRPESAAVLPDDTPGAVPTSVHAPHGRQVEADRVAQVVGGGDHIATPEVYLDDAFVMREVGAVVQANQREMERDELPVPEPSVDASQPVQVALATVHQRMAGAAAFVPPTQEERDQRSIDFVVALLEQGDFSGARLQVTAIANRELRFEWLAYVDARWADAFSSGTDA
ncbi:MAG: HTH domain-containing protein [Chloroflexales bacterium]|nr:HTH domain-containing protein [Chloroflexales bacterium]